MSTVVLNILIILFAISVWIINHALEEKTLKKLEAEIKEEAKKK